jgi:hypothetical protein
MIVKFGDSLPGAAALLPRNWGYAGHFLNEGASDFAHSRWLKFQILGLYVVDKD